ncbi:hypothetical protein FS749_009218 [Ceratobasidium sp. UAMH 11750]|nr:hypothetical protein FS749_009218 [Ceratobasidium sp. UAMH 11750]
MAPVLSKPLPEPSSSTRKGKRNPRASAPDAAGSTPVVKKRGGRLPGSKNISIEEKSAFVDLVDEMKPLGNAGWDRVYATYNAQHPGATRKPKTLRKLWDELTAGRPPTGNSPMDILIRRALDVAAAIEVATATKTLADEGVPPPIGYSESDDEESDDDDGSDMELKNDPNAGDGSPEWVPSDTERSAPVAGPSGTSKHDAVLVTGTSSFGEGGPRVKPRPKPRPKPIPAEELPPMTPCAVTTLGKLGPVFPPSSALSIKPKVKAEPKGKGKAAPLPLVEPITDSDCEVLSDKGETQTPAKRKPTTTAADTSRIVRRKPDTAAGVVKSAAARTRQNADTVISQMLDSFNPAHTQQAIETQQSHTVSNMMIFEYQQRIQGLDRALADSNRRLDEERERRMNDQATLLQLRMELSQAQTTIAMNGGAFRYGFGGAGVGMVGAGAGGFGAVGNPVGMPQGLQQGFNPVANAPGMMFNGTQVPTQPGGGVSGTYNPAFQPGPFSTSVASAPVAPEVPIPPVAPVQAPATPNTPNTNAGEGAGN